MPRLFDFTFALCTTFALFGLCRAEGAGFLSSFRTAKSRTKGDVSVCPGESARYGDHKCNHDETHRVCAIMVAAIAIAVIGTRLPAGPATSADQNEGKWHKEICQTPGGTSWCICMWATATLISTVGCDKVQINCGATDVDHVLKAYEDTGVHGTVKLEPAKECLKKKCGGAGGAPAAGGNEAPATPASTPSEAAATPASTPAEAPATSNEGPAPASEAEEEHAGRGEDKKVRPAEDRLKKEEEEGSAFCC